MFKSFRPTRKQRMKWTIKINNVLTRFLKNLDSGIFTMEINR